MRVHHAAALLPSCATNQVPQLGHIDNGRYYDAAARFACPVPGEAQGFKGPVRVIDAVASTESFIPASRIEFIETLQPARQISISFQPLSAGTDVSHADFDAEGNGRVALGSTTLYRLPVHYAMLQVPYQQPEHMQPIELHLLANFVIPVDGEAYGRTTVARAGGQRR